MSDSTTSSDRTLVDADAVRTCPSSLECNTIAERNVWRLEVCSLNPSGSGVAGHDMLDKLRGEQSVNEVPSLIYNVSASSHRVCFSNCISPTLEAGHDAMARPPKSE